MDLQTDMTKRTKLKQFASFIMLGDGTSTKDETVEAKQRRVHEKLKKKIDKFVPSEQDDEFWGAVYDYSSVQYDAAFSLGMKMGARVLCTLLDNSEVML